ncbi:zinc finger C2HC domain-containing protein 1A-like [Clytia hemisphaerica]|uniref:C2HC/C3H-type domain-containing protein n=1 Tax=Clytia hemisphaerica TaxID=252671 RepID=A0A7M5XC09_9CNID|eukprot:TCONS_00016474-protein
MYSDSYDEDDDAPYDDVPVSLVPCSNCGRKFNSDSLARHENVCSNLKPRKVFDSSKQRTEGLEKPKVTRSDPPKKAPRKKDWRRQHDEFIKNIRAARGVKKALETGGELPPPPEPSYNPDYVQCQHCNRRFNESAAERHIKFCKEQKSRLPKAPSDSKFSQKSEKQKIRTQYRPPVPGQKKSSTSSPAKPRGSASDMRSPAVKKGSATKVKKVEDDERPIPQTNGRYNQKDYTDSPSTAKSKHNKNTDPDWMVDLKRGSSAKKTSAKSQRSGHNLNDNDSGVDINENNDRRRRTAEREADLFGQKKDRHPSAGRRVTSSNKGSSNKLANFCHDCGTKYPVVEAKFCCECGLRRMAIT